MNYIRYRVYKSSGVVADQADFVPSSHINTDYEMREIARRKGCPAHDGNVVMFVTDRLRKVEWLDEQGNFHCLMHRMDRRISYIEITFRNAEVGVRIKRGGTDKARLHRVKASSLGVELLFGMIRSWQNSGRMKVKASDLGVGIMILPLEMIA